MHTILFRFINEVCRFSEVSEGPLLLDISRTFQRFFSAGWERHLWLGHAVLILKWPCGYTSWPVIWGHWHLSSLSILANASVCQTRSSCPEAGERQQSSSICQRATADSQNVNVTSGNDQKWKLTHWLAEMSMQGNNNRNVPVFIPIHSQYDPLQPSQVCWLLYLPPSLRTLNFEVNIKYPFYLCFTNNCWWVVKQHKPQLKILKNNRLEKEEV